ncbi:hypothetical protein J1614_011150 [Plenodomus biglobosus]|nr:hypothetical protein J1614_011150 [Plenodomus biglobosus]
MALLERVLLKLEDLCSELVKMIGIGVALKERRLLILEDDAFIELEGLCDEFGELVGIKLGDAIREELEATRVFLEELTFADDLVKVDWVLLLLVGTLRDDVRSELSDELARVDEATFEDGTCKETRPADELCEDDREEELAEVEGVRKTPVAADDDTGDKIKESVALVELTLTKI